MWVSVLYVQLDFESGLDILLGYRVSQKVSQQNQAIERKTGVSKALGRNDGCNSLASSHPALALLAPVISFYFCSFIE